MAYAGGVLDGQVVPEPTGVEEVVVLVTGVVVFVELVELVFTDDDEVGLTEDVDLVLDEDEDEGLTEDVEVVLTELVEVDFTVEEGLAAVVVTIWHWL
jgi:hypothetical protein